MKLKVKLCNYLEDNCGYGINMHTHIDADDILKSLDLSDEDEFDVDTHTRRVVNSVLFWDSVDGVESEAEERASQIVRDLNLHGPRCARAFDDLA